MNFTAFLSWLAANKDGFTALGVIVTILATVIGGLWALRKCRKPAPECVPGSTYTVQGHQFNAGNGSVIKDIHVGDIYQHGLSFDDAMKLAEKLAAEKGEKDAQVIQSLQETIQALQALTQQNTAPDNIQKALNLLRQGNTTKAEEIFARIAAQARQKGQAANHEEAAALRHLGSLAFLHDTWRALDAYKRSTALDPDNLDGWNQLGHLYRRTGELENAENAYRMVLKLAADDQANQAIAYGNLGNVYRIRHEFSRAIELYQKSLVIYKALSNKEGMAVVYSNLGIVYQIGGDLNQAIEHYCKALLIDEELGRKEGLAAVYSNLGIVHQNCGDFYQAIEFYNKALVLNQEIGRKEGMASNCGNLGAVCQILGNLDQAIEFYQKALTINEALSRKEGMANQYGNLGNVYQIRGDFDQAIEHYYKALPIDEELGRKEGMANQYGSLGNIYQTRGDLDRAIVYWEKSLALFQQIGDKDKIELVQSRLTAIKQNSAAE